MDYKDKKDDELVDHTLNTSTKALNEMMRRLKDSIEKLDSNATKWNKNLLAATLVLLVVATVQLVVSIFLSGINPWIGMVVEISALGFIIYLAIKIVDISKK